MPKSLQYPLLLSHIFNRFLAQSQAYVGNNSNVSLNETRFNTVMRVEDNVSPVSCIATYRLRDNLLDPSREFRTGNASHWRTFSAI